MTWDDEVVEAVFVGVWRTPIGWAVRPFQPASAVEDDGLKQHPDEPFSDGQIFTQPWPAGPKDQRRDQVIYYQYRSDRGRRTLRGIDEQVAKAEKAVQGKTAVKRNRFIQLTGATKSVNRTLEAKARALAGLKGHATNLQACPDGTPVTAEFVIGAYHRLYLIETSKPQCCHSCGWSALSSVPSRSVFMRAA